MQEVINKTYESYFSGVVLDVARQSDDQSRLQFLLRLQDFATVIEAKRAMAEGDIGRLIRMWKRWSVMIQGMDGLTHYSNYLPRLILLLQDTLPEHLQKIMTKTLLISPSGRPGHFVAKDFFLEVMNYWIKFFYNNSVSHHQSNQSV